MIPETPFAKTFLHSVLSLLRSDLDIGEDTANEVMKSLAHLLVKEEQGEESHTRTKCGETALAEKAEKEEERQSGNRKASKRKAEMEQRQLREENDEENNNYSEADQEIDRIIRGLEAESSSSSPASTWQSVPSRPSTACSSVLSFYDDGMPSVRSRHLDLLSPASGSSSESSGSVWSPSRSVSDSPLPPPIKKGKINTNIAKKNAVVVTKDQFIVRSSANSKRTQAAQATFVPYSLMGRARTITKGNGRKR